MSFSIFAGLEMASGNTELSHKQTILVLYFFQTAAKTYSYKLDLLTFLAQSGNLSIPTV